MAGAESSPRATPTTIDLTDSDLIDLDAPDVLVEEPRSGPIPLRWALLCLVAGFVLGLAGAWAAGAWQSGQQPGYEATAQWTAVSTYLDSLNAHDVKDLRASLTDDFAWRGYDPDGNVVAGPLLVDDYLAFQAKYFPEFHVTMLGTPVIRGNDVMVPLHVDPGYGAYDSFSVMTVQRDGSQLRVARVLCIPTAAAR